MDKLIDITEPQIAPFLNILLSDKSTKKNIIWATDSFQELGNGFSDTAGMNARLLTENPTCILPRIEKTGKRHKLIELGNAQKFLLRLGFAIE